MIALSSVVTFIVSTAFTYYQTQEDVHKYWEKIAYFRRVSVVFSLDSKELIDNNTIISRLNSLRGSLITIPSDGPPVVIDRDGKDIENHTEIIDKSQLIAFSTNDFSERLAEIRGKNYYLYKIPSSSSLSFLAFPLNLKDLHFSIHRTNAPSIEERYLIASCVGNFARYPFATIVCWLLVHLLTFSIFYYGQSGKRRIRINHLRERRKLHKATLGLKEQLKNDKYQLYNSQRAMNQYSEALFALIKDHIRNFELILPSLKLTEPLEKNILLENVKELTVFNPFKNEKVTVKALVQRITDFFQSEIREKEIHIQLDIKSSRSVIFIDDVYLFYLFLYMFKVLIGGLGKQAFLSIQAKTKDKYLHILFKGTFSNFHSDLLILNSIRHLGGNVRPLLQGVDIKIPLDILTPQSCKANQKDSNVVKLFKIDS